MILLWKDHLTSHSTIIIFFWLQQMIVNALNQTYTVTHQHQICICAGRIVSPGFRC